MIELVSEKGMVCKACGLNLTEKEKKLVGFGKRGEDVLRFVERGRKNWVDVFVLIEIYFFSVDVIFDVMELGYSGAL